LQEDDRVPLFHNMLKTRRMENHTDVFASRAIQTTAELLRKFECVTRYALGGMRYGSVRMQRKTR